MEQDDDDEHFDDLDDLDDSWIKKMTLMTGGAPVEQPGRAVVRDGVGGQRVEDCCLHDEQVGGGASGDDDLMMRMIIMAMMTMRIIMMMTPKTELCCAAASREKEGTGRAREQQVELGEAIQLLEYQMVWREGQI